MRPMLTTLCFLTLPLGACDRDCDPDEALCGGEIRWGQAAFAVNPASLEGDYAPELAGCTVTRTDASGSVDIVHHYDRLGRLTHASSPLGADAGDFVRELDWEDGCITRDHTDLYGCAVEIDRTCDDQGWPVEERQVFVTGDGTRSEPILRHFDRTYDGHQLVGTLTWTERNGIDELDGSRTIRWAHGRPATEDSTTPDGALPYYRSTWTWDGDRLVERTGTLLGRDDEQSDRWSYRYDGADLLTEVRIGNERVISWLRKPSAYWPYREITADGTRYDLEVLCDGETDLE